MPVLADGTPLCQVPELVGRPHAYVKLWKHHAAQGQADRVNAVAAERGEAWLARYGGRISDHEITIRNGWPSVRARVGDAREGIADVDACVATALPTCSKLREKLSTPRPRSAAIS